MRHEPQDPVELLRLFVQGRDVSCPTCAYNLRNTASTCCPECGTPLGLHVGSSRAPLGVWPLAFLAAALPLGFWLSVIAIGSHALHMWWQSSQANQVDATWYLGRSDWQALGLAGAASVVYATAVLVVVMRRGRWTARSRALRWGGTFAWAASLLGLHVIGMYLLIRILGGYE